MSKLNTQVLIKASFVRLFAILTLGVFGGGQGIFSSNGEVSRFEFFRDYLLPSFYLFILSSGLYRIICYAYGLFSLSFTSRRILFSAMVTPAIFILFIGEMKRLRDIGLWAYLVLFNFYIPYGMLACGLICAFIPNFRKRHKPLTSRFLR